MKTLTKTLIASALTAIVLTSSAITTFAANPGSPLVLSFKADTVSFNKVVITGNPKIILVKGLKEEVRIEEYYHRSKTTIARKGYSLLINSTEKSPVTITVTVKDLCRIQAFDNASITTMGTLDLTYLQIFLNDNARADVKANANSMYTILKDASTLKLSGSAESHTYIANNTEGIVFANFVCRKTDKLTSEPLASN